MIVAVSNVEVFRMHSLSENPTALLCGSPDLILSPTVVFYAKPNIDTWTPLLRHNNSVTIEW